MRYFIRIFLSIVFTVGLGFWGYGYWLMDEIKKQHEITTEDALVDISNLLASQLSSKIKRGVIDVTDVKKTFKNFQKIKFKVDIHGAIKETSAINAYVTDKNGMVIFDSAFTGNVGSDFSRWRDVYRTLKGEYGARSTPTDPDDPFSHVFYVAAPIKFKNHIIGVVSVSKSVKSFLNFVTTGQEKIIFMIFIIFIAAITLAMLFSYWLTRPIYGLIKYAQTVTNGGIARPPKTSFKDFRKLGSAFEDMRISLEKKESIKNYVDDVTHALKSPLTTIKATAEIFQNDVPQDKVHLFSHIETEVDRASKLLNDLLEVARLENQRGLKKVDNLYIKELMEETLKLLDPLIKKKNIKVKTEWDSSKFNIKGERFLILQIFENLILNAVDFSPVEGKILIKIKEDNKTFLIFVRDQGPGIPEYAKDKIFEKFYSLERPSGKKSTGLGLTFAREAILLHGGVIQLEPSSQEMSGANFKIALSKS
jgi:two-component system, OmpR family, sensor histidine kinase CreC